MKQTIEIDKDIEKMQFCDLQYHIHETAKNKGWWDKERKDAEVIALIHSEVSEVLECLREGKSVYYEKPIKNKEGVVFPSEYNTKPEGVGIELADTVIRILDFAQSKGIDLEKMIKIKMTFNRTRPYMHGKRF